MGGVMNSKKFDFDFFGLRIRVKLDAGYILLQRVGAPSGSWHLTVPIAPKRKGADVGMFRPHLSREVDGKKERKAFDANTLLPVDVNGDDWPAAFKYVAEDFLRLADRLEPMQAELRAIEHWESYEYDEATLRSMVIAVRVHDQERNARNSAKMMAWMQQRDSFVVEHPLTALPVDLESDWEGPDRLDVLAPGTHEHPIDVRLRCACGTETETKIYRRSDGVWVERRYCCHGHDAQRREIIDRYVGPEFRTMYEEVVGLLGLSEGERHPAPVPGAEGPAPATAPDAASRPNRPPASAVAAPRRRRPTRPGA
jgi:hypothetical protein